MKREFFYKFIKFGLVGFSGVFVDFGTTALLREIAGFNQYVANSTGFLCAVISNYTLNRVWTFRSRDPRVVAQFSKFFLASLIGLGLNNSLVYLLYEKAVVPFYIAKAIATGVVMVWNFWANYTFTFQQKG
ncbi:MAG: GtrA family protein [Saprospiraceae bacterium]|nr:GtrA family protein [Saprospiraceae bacterium]MDW8483847.1 GtrA family protein [Saprospiraceae bacterium]